MVWLANEQMNVVGHHDVADHHKLVALADLLENLQEQIALARAGQPGLAMITATGEKVEIVVAGVALEACGHIFTLFEGRSWGMGRSGSKSCSVRIWESHPCTKRKGGPPARTPSNSIFRRVMWITRVCDGTD